MWLDTPRYGVARGNIDPSYKERLAVIRKASRGGGREVGDVPCYGPRCSPFQPWWAGATLVRWYSGSWCIRVVVSQGLQKQAVRGGLASDIRLLSMLGGQANAGSEWAGDKASQWTGISDGGTGRVGGVVGPRGWATRGSVVKVESECGTAARPSLKWVQQLCGCLYVPCRDAEAQISTPTRYI